MVMSKIFTAILLISVLSAVLPGNGAALSAAVAESIRLHFDTNIQKEK